MRPELGASDAHCSHAARIVTLSGWFGHNLVNLCELRGTQPHFGRGKILLQVLHAFGGNNGDDVVALVQGAGESELGWREPPFRRQKSLIRATS